MKVLEGRYSSLRRNYKVSNSPQFHSYYTRLTQKHTHTHTPFLLLLLYPNHKPFHPLLRQKLISLKYTSTLQALLSIYLFTRAPPLAEIPLLPFWCHYFINICNIVFHKTSSWLPSLGLSSKSSLVSPSLTSYFYNHNKFSLITH